MALNLMLSSNVIATIFWGPEMVMIYNDLYRTHLGSKHPALGQTLRAAWAGVYELVEPLFCRATSDRDCDRRRADADAGPPERADDGEDLHPRCESGARGEERKSVILGLYQTATDHTERVQTASWLLAAEAQATRVLESIGDAVIVTDAESRIIRMNPVAEALTGWSTRDASMQPSSEVFRIVDEKTQKQS